MEDAFEKTAEHACEGNRAEVGDVDAVWFLGDRECDGGVPVCWCEASEATQGEEDGEVVTEGPFTQGGQEADMDPICSTGSR